MAQAPALKAALCSLGKACWCLGTSRHWHRRWRLGQCHGHDSSSSLKHILQLPVGNPCPCSHNTKPSWPRTNPPSNWQIQRRNRTAHSVAHSTRSHHPGSGSLCHAPDNTIPSWEQTNQPASSRTHPGNCRDLLGLVVASAAHRCGGSCSTTAVWLDPTRRTAPRRNCMDQQVQLGLLGLAALLVAARTAAAWAAAWAVAWAAVWVAVLGMGSAELSVWFLAKLSSRSPCPRSYSNSPSAPGATWHRIPGHSPKLCNPKAGTSTGQTGATSARE